jgi:hypothetical protein
MAQAPKVGVRRRISFDGETFAALDCLARDRMSKFRSSRTKRFAILSRNIAGR